MSRRRVTAPAAVLVCSVDRHQVTGEAGLYRDLGGLQVANLTDHDHVRVLAQYRAQARCAKVISTLVLTCDWPIPSMKYSIGSSTVMMLRLLSLMRSSAAYSVVVLPEPVGPVTRMMPCGLWMSSIHHLLRLPRPCRAIRDLRRPACLSSSRSTTRSPCPEGMVDTRTSTARPAILQGNAAVLWQSLFRDVELRHDLDARDTTSGASARRVCSTSCSTPSTRKAHAEPVLVRLDMDTSDAFSLTPRSVRR